MTIKINSLPIFLIISLNNLRFLEAQTWIKSAYYDSSSNLPVSTVNSAPFTHLYYAFARINSSTYQLSFSDESTASTFTASVKLKNPSIVTLLSIGLAYGNYSTFSSMVSHPSSRKYFITSSIKTARLYGFHGLDLCWAWPKSSSDMENIGILLDEWRAAINSESINSPLILTMAVFRHPVVGAASFPVDSIWRNLDWANFVAFDYHFPLKENVTGYHAALFDSSGGISTDSGIRAWIGRGLPASKLVLGLPYHGYAWKLASANENSVGAAASGPALNPDGSIGYKAIKSFILDYGYGVSSAYDSSDVVNYFNIKQTWINFDDVEAIKTKILYAKDKGLRGYFAFQLANDFNWKLSIIAHKVGEDHESKKKLWIVVSVPISVVILLVILSFLAYTASCRMLKTKGKIDFSRAESSKLESNRKVNKYQEHNAPDLGVFTFSEIKAATSNFCCEKKLGEGGYGPVYKGTLARGQEIAVKRLSKASNQGLKEFKTEVKLIAKLQHVNLVRLLGICIEKGEKMLIYEYMPNKSLDFYLFDLKERSKFNWEQRVQIIEGIVQGLLYLQEYSNFTIIHRDIKASNILLDHNMKPKISDFGMARIFNKDENIEAKTGQIVGTYGYAPPEYVRGGMYSTKYDVYSFGVLLLQIISGKKITCFYGLSENQNLLEYAYELWISDNCKEFIDPTLVYSLSSCKFLICFHVALLCVQESPKDRPSILEVYSMLKNENYIIPCPKRPAFSSSEDEDIGCRVGQEICSVNSVTLSQMLPR